MLSGLFVDVWWSASDVCVRCLCLWLWFFFLVFHFLLFLRSFLLLLFRFFLLPCLRSSFHISRVSYKSWLSRIDEANRIIKSLIFTIPLLFPWQAEKSVNSLSTTYETERPELRGWVVCYDIARMNADAIMPMNLTISVWRRKLYGKRTVWEWKKRMNEWTSGSQITAGAIYRSPRALDSRTKVINVIPLCARVVHSVSDDTHTHTHT